MARPFFLACFGPAALSILAGCGGGPGAPAAAKDGVPLGLQMVRTDAQMRKYPFRTLLDFETPTDPVFVRVEGPTARLEAGESHTGGGSLVLDPGVRSLVVRLGSLTSGTSFPGRWTLLGAYFHAPQSQRMTATYEVEGAAPTSVSVEIPANQWTPVLLDLSAIDNPDPSKVGVLRFDFGAGLAGPVRFDNVVVLDNTQLLVDGGATSYSVKERGFAYLVERPMAFKIALKTPEAVRTGWRLEEANAIRCRFSSSGEAASWTLYADGRSFKGGVCDVLGGDSRTKEMFRTQHENAARLSIGGEAGRVRRNSPGDADNDGYSEATGAYQLVASGPRLEVLVTPRSPLLARPVLEIADLPSGKILATMEGRLVEKVVRLDDGRVLLELPGTLDRATTVNVRVGP